MPAYKLYNGNPCQMKMCDCTCKPSDGSITIAKLAQETIDWVVGKERPDKVPVVAAELNVSWRNDRTGEVSTDLDITAEAGDTYEWKGSYVWYSTEGHVDPYKLESNVFDILTADGVMSDTKMVPVEADSTFTVELSAMNGSSSVVSSSMKYLHPIYYGMKGSKLTKKLCESQNITLPVTAPEKEYFVFKYPITLPKLETITMDGSMNVIQAFDYSEEVFTTDTEVETRLRVYTAAYPGAFTNVKLTFK